MDLSILIPIAQGADPTDGLKSIALGVGAGLGTIGPGIGVGYIFGKVIESVTRQPEMRDEITSIQWLGITLLILRRLAYPRIAEALDKRRRAIAESIDAAERTRTEADQLLQEYRERLREAREQADDIVARARKASDK